MMFLGLEVVSASLGTQIFDTYPEYIDWNLALTLKSNHLFREMVLNENEELKDIQIFMNINSTPIGERWLLDREGCEPSKSLGIAQYLTPVRGTTPMVIFSISVADNFRSKLIDLVKSGRTPTSFDIDIEDIDDNLLPPGSRSTFDSESKWDVRVANRREIKSFSFKISQQLAGG